MAYSKIKIDGQELVDFSDTTATRGDVKAGKKFYTSNGVLVDGTYTVPVETIKIMPSATEKITQTPTEGKYCNKVEVEQVKTTELEIDLSDYLGDESNTEITYDPEEGLYSKVTIIPAEGEEEEVTPSLEEQTITPSNGKTLKKVTVKAIPESRLQRIALEAPIFNKTLEAAEGYYGIKQVTISGYSTKFAKVDNELGEGI